MHTYIYGAGIKKINSIWDVNIDKLPLPQVKGCSEEVDFVPVFGTQVPDEENDLSPRLGHAGEDYLYIT